SDRAEHDDVWGSGRMGAVVLRQFSLEPGPGPGSAGSRSAGQVCGVVADAGGLGHGVVLLGLLQEVTAPRPVRLSGELSGSSGFLLVVADGLLAAHNGLLPVSGWVMVRAPGRSRSGALTAGPGRWGQAVGRGMARQVVACLLASLRDSRGCRSW